MRKIILLLIGLLAISTIGTAQKKVHFGFYLGSSITNMSGVDKLATMLTDTLSQTVGKNFPIKKGSRSFLFNGGCFISYSVTPNIDIITGFEYAPKGQKFNGEVILTTDPFTFKSQVLRLEEIMKVGYLEIPVSIQFSTRSLEKPDKVYFSGSIGFSPAYKIFSKLEATASHVEQGFDSNGTTEKVIETNSTTVTLNGIKDFDMGIFCSIGLHANSGYISLKVDKGLGNIAKYTADGNIKNNMYALHIGFTF